MNPAKKSLNQKAPKINFEELKDLITNKILSDGIKQRATAVWITGSFTDPNREIDTSEYPSDLDIIVVIPDWEYPMADTGILFTAPQVETPAIYEGVVEDIRWESKDGGWDTAEEAWEDLPEYARETLRQSFQHVFRANEEDVQQERIRQYDVTIIDEERRAEMDTSGEIRVWPRDEE